MKNQVLMICYSRTGTTLTAAKLLAAMTGWQIATVEDIVPRSGWLGDLRCAWEAIWSRKPPYRYVGPSPDQFGHVVVMSPIWMGRLASPMRAFLQDTRDLHGGHERLPSSFSAICLMASKGGFRAADDMARLTGHAPWPAMALEEREVLTGAATNLIREFAEDVRSAVKSLEPTPQRPHWLSPKEA